MIIFQLRCSDGHEFEGWFSDHDDYEHQRTSKLLVCPLCHNGNVQKVLSQLSLVKGNKGEAAAKKLKIDPVILVKTIDQFVKKNFENVGKDFYRQAVQMHRGEQPGRRIYGEVTKEERGKLDEEEIEYAVVPKLAPQFEN
jgi:hypothetical protein